MSRIYDALKKLEAERGQATEPPESSIHALVARIVRTDRYPIEFGRNKSLPLHRGRVGRTALVLGLIAMATVCTRWWWGPVRHPTDTSVARVDGTIGGADPRPVPMSKSAAPTAPREPEVVRAIPAPEIPQAPREPPSTDPQITGSAVASGIVPQVGAFLRAENAEGLRLRLSNLYRTVYIQVAARDGRSYHCVRIGGMANEAEQRAVASALRSAGYAPIPVHE